MANTRLYKTYSVNGELAPHRLVTLAGASTVAQATGSEKTLIGVSDELGKQSNGHADIAMSDLPEVEAGGVFAPGDPLTGDADGRAVKAESSGACIIGFALASAATAGEIVPFLFAPGIFSAGASTVNAANEGA